MASGDFSYFNSGHIDDDDDDDDEEEEEEEEEEEHCSQLLGLNLAPL